MSEVAKESWFFVCWAVSLISAILAGYDMLFEREFAFGALVVAAIADFGAAFFNFAAASHVLIAAIAVTVAAITLKGKVKELSFLFLGVYATITVATVAWFLNS